MEGDFELNIVKQNNKFKCMILIHFQDSSKIENKEFLNYKKLIKFLKMFLKSSVEFQDAIILLEEFKSKVEGSD